MSLRSTLTNRRARAKALKIEERTAVALVRKSLTQRDYLQATKFLAIAIKCQWMARGILDGSYQ